MPACGTGMSILYVEAPYTDGVVVVYAYPNIITVITVPLGTLAPLSETVPWKRHGGPPAGGVAIGGGVIKGVAVGTGVGVGVGVGVGDSVGATVGVGVGVGVGAAPPPQPKAPNTSTSTANGINTTAIFLILPFTSLSPSNSPDYTTEKSLEE
jgi:hypothetical protein